MNDFIAFGRPNFGPLEIEQVTRVMESGWVGMGAETITFEDELAHSLQSGGFVTVNSCTSALFLSLLVSGVGVGDEVICPSFTWCSTANAALYLGATAVFADIDPHTLSVTTETILARVTSRTKAVVVVHFGGYAVDVAGLRAALPAHIRIVEDAAHALGSTYADGRPVGSSGHLTCFSFYANKNLSTGEGGGIAVRDPVVRDRLKELRLHALPIDAWKRYSSARSILVSPPLTELGYKMNFTDLQAAIGRVQLRRQAGFAQQRQSIARRFHATLSKEFPEIAYQQDVFEPSHARHLFVLLLPEHCTPDMRTELILRMRADNVGATIHYAPLHSMPLYRFPNRLPVTEGIARHIMSLPISARMTMDEADLVVRSFEKNYRDVVAKEPNLAS